MTPGTPLGKRQVEALLATYDTDPVSALTVALRHVCGASEADFDELVPALGLGEQRTAALLARDVAALDGLARQLNEERTIRAGDTAS